MNITPQEFTQVYLDEQNSLEDICHKFQIHPESVLRLAMQLNIQRKSDRQAKALFHFGFALGVLLGRFEILSGRIKGIGEVLGEEKTVSGKTPEFLKEFTHGFIYVSALEEMRQSIPEPNAYTDRNILTAMKKVLEFKNGTEKTNTIWGEIELALALDCRETVSNADRDKYTVLKFLREDYFSFHRDTYENRPIYFPLSSKKKSFVVYANIHEWSDGTINTILAEALYPDLKSLLDREQHLIEQKTNSNKADNKSLDQSLFQIQKWKEELQEFCNILKQISEKGPVPPQAGKSSTKDKLTSQERENTFHMELDDGVMINLAILHPVIVPQWKEPEKWWNALVSPVGKTDYDWSHQAMRYWKDRVIAKIKKDPSLAVAHSFHGEFKEHDFLKEYHPALTKEKVVKEDKQQNLGMIEEEKKTTSKKRKTK